jgi:hypothetical protein
VETHRERHLSTCECLQATGVRVTGYRCPGLDYIEFPKP